MARVEKTVFISYRRTNTPWALAIYQNLHNNGYDVFFDFKGIASGDFESVILGNIRSRAHFIVLLTPSALERCGEPKDWLRREIEEALAIKRNIVPLMLEGFDFSTPAIANQLTGKLAALKRYNALDVPASYSMEAMDRLRQQYLNVPLKAVLHPTTVSAQRATKRQQAAADTAPAVSGKELTAQQWFERGLNTKDLDEQIRCYTHAIRLKLDYASAFNNRGVARKEKGAFDSAIADYEEAIRLKPNYFAAFNNRGNARVAQGDINGGIADYDEAIRLKSDYADAFNNRGNARKSKGDIDDALEDYNRALQLRPNFAEAFNNRGNARLAKGDPLGAIEDYSEAIRIRPDYVNAFYNRGNVKRNTGNMEEALQDYNTTIRLRPTDPDAFFNRGLLFQSKSSHEHAIADFKKYLELGGGIRDGDQADVEQRIRDLTRKLEARPKDVKD